MNLSFMDTGELLGKALAGQKLFPEEAIYLCAEGDLLNLAMAGREIARRLHPEGRVGYAVAKTVVYSNVCQPNCPFCTGTVTKDDPAAFTKSAAEVVAEVTEAVAAGATQITLQGGHRIDLPWEYYPGLVRAIKDRFPDVQIFAYSPTEIMVFNVAYQKGTAQVIAELQAAGMGALFAGGAESMATRAPEYRALLRGPWNEWFDVVHRCAAAGIPVVVPFVFGLGESAKERIGHLYRIRAVQERTAANKRPAFISLAVFNLPVIPEGGTPVTGHQYLRMVALARVLVPHVPHVQSSFVTQGAKVAQVALDGGADDFGGTNLEFTTAELAAGRVGPMTADEVERLIRDAGRTPERRTGW
jgi:cyclic dehypoxanthinyl futalosine synthase